MAQEVKTRKRRSPKKRKAARKTGSVRKRRSPRKTTGGSRKTARKSTRTKLRRRRRKATASGVFGAKAPKRRRRFGSSGGGISLKGIFKTGKKVLPIVLGAVGIGLAAATLANAIAPRREGQSFNAIAPILGLGIPILGGIALKKFGKVKVNPNMVAGAAITGVTVAAFADKLIGPILTVPGFGHVASIGDKVGQKVKTFMPAAGQGIGRLFNRGGSNSQGNTTTSPARRGISGMDDVHSIRRLNHATS